MVNEFETHLRKENLSENTIASYVMTVKLFESLTDEITKKAYWHSRGIYLKPISRKLSIFGYRQSTNTWTL